MRAAIYAILLLRFIHSISASIQPLKTSLISIFAIIIGIHLFGISAAAPIRVKSC
jgi:hypothetical protein